MTLKEALTKAIEEDMEAREAVVSWTGTVPVPVVRRLELPNLRRVVTVELVEMHYIGAAPGAPAYTGVFQW